MTSLLLGITLDDVGDWFVDHGVAVVVPVVLAIVGTYLIRRLVPHLLRPPIEREMADKPTVEIDRRVVTLSSVITRTAQVVFILMALLTIGPEFGINIGPVLAGVGITGLALTLGAQSLVRDTLNGMFILSENQYARGDIITVAGVTGTVEDVTLRRTILRDVDGVVYSVPNSAVIVSANYTRGASKVRVTVPVAAASDFAAVRRVCDEVGIALAADPEYSDKIVTPPTYLRIEGIDMNGVAVQASGTVRPGSQWEVAGVLRARLLDAFQREGIKTPWG